MKKLCIGILIYFSLPGYSQSFITIKISDGQLQGLEEKNIAVFKGIPYAQPPVGSLRWQDPKPVKPWKGVRPAVSFGARPMQRFIYKDMMFRSRSTSEDCLYLNVWAPADSIGHHLPVLVYFHGGGLSAGDGSELRYDGKNIAQKGIIMVTVNYRLGIFGFYSHPDLTKESAHKSSGNYGFLDQRAALLWIKKNIIFFGGDPNKVTIAGQSAGSISVSAHMASPLSKGLFRFAIGQSGSILTSLAPVSKNEAEQTGIRFNAMMGITSLSLLRNLPPDTLLAMTAREGSPGFRPVIDGYFLRQAPMDIFATGLQADVPLLAGWTSAEVTYHNLLGKDSLSFENYSKVIHALYNNKAAAILQLYPGNTKEQLLRSATDLASDRFIAYSTWKWIDLHAKTSGSIVYRYLFDKKLPALSDTAKDNREPLQGAPHSADIEYALGNLTSNKVYAWDAVDETVSNLMQTYFVNFIKTGNPNGDGVPIWPGLQSSIPKVMVFGETSHAEQEKNLIRYTFLDQFYK